MKNLRFALSLCAVTLLSVAFIIMVGVFYNPALKAKNASENTVASIKSIPKYGADSLYAQDFELPLSDGSTLKLADFEGKVLLIVNTAAKCGFAKQLKELEELHQRYKDKGLVIIGVSSDDFGQEIEDQEERVCYLEDHFPTTFIITDTVHVITSKGQYDACPLYKWLNKKGKKKSAIGSVQWNFHKFLIGKDGTFINWFAMTTSPTKKKVIKAIEKALAA